MNNWDFVIFPLRPPYLQFICFDVATAICIISPPCLKEIERTKENIGLRAALFQHGFAPHHDTLLQSDLHFSLDMNCLQLNRSSLFNCGRSLIFPLTQCNQGGWPQKLWPFSGMIPSPVCKAEGNKETEKEMEKGEKVILMNVLI